MVGSPAGNQASVASRLLKGHELNKLQGRPRAVVVGAGVVGLSQVCKSRRGMGVLAFDYGHCDRPLNFWSPGAMCALSPKAFRPKLHLTAVVGFGARLLLD
jgi:hypothetical protein